MKAFELLDRIGDEINKVDSLNRPLTVEELKAINDVWHDLIYQAKGDVCDHPESDRWQGYCWKCSRNVETAKEAQCLQNQQS